MWANSCGDRALVEFPVRFGWGLTALGFGFRVWAKGIQY